jgi:WD40 repeat protein
VAVANGTIKIFKREDPANLASFGEFREINLMRELGECTCLAWNPAFDEPTSLIVGCNITTPSQFLESNEYEENQKNEVQLLQMVILKDNKDNDQKIPINGNPNLNQGLENNVFHKQMINDVQWAPLAGRSFHLVATCSKDQTVIIWRTVLFDIMQGELLELP